MNLSFSLSPLVKNKKRAEHHARKPRRIVPPQLLAQIEHGEHRENTQGNKFLNRLKLRRRKFIRPDSVRWNLKTLFKKCNSPARQNYLPERLAPILQMSIPRKRHKNIRHRQQQNRTHFTFSPSLAMSMKSDPYGFLLARDIRMTSSCGIVRPPPCQPPTRPSLSENRGPTQFRRADLPADCLSFLTDRCGLRIRPPAFVASAILRLVAVNCFGTRQRSFIWIHRGRDTVEKS